MKTQVSVTHDSPPSSPASPLMEVSGALVGIILLILAAAWVAKRLGMSGTKGAGAKGLQVSASTSVGQRERVVIVNVDDARLVLGVTAHQVTLLHTLPPAPQEPGSDKNSPPDFAALMKNVIKRPGRS